MKQQSPRSQSASARRYRGTAGLEQQRVDSMQDDSTGWRRFGPYLSDRAWGTVREDYSADGNAWKYLTYDMARAKATRSASFSAA